MNSTSTTQTEKLVIFLDVDGVLVTSRCLQCSYDQNDQTLIFDPADVEYPIEKRCVS